MDPDLHFKGFSAVFLIQRDVLLKEKRHLLLGCLCRENVSKRDILEAKGLTNVIVIRNVASIYDELVSLLKKKSKWVFTFQRVGIHS